MQGFETYDYPTKSMRYCDALTWPLDRRLTRRARPGRRDPPGLAQSDHPSRLDRKADKLDKRSLNPPPTLGRFFGGTPPLCVLVLGI